MDELAETHWPVEAALTAEESAELDAAIQLYIWEFLVLSMYPDWRATYH